MFLEHDKLNCIEGLMSKTYPLDINQFIAIYGNLCVLFYQSQSTLPRFGEIEHCVLYIFNFMCIRKFVVEFLNRFKSTRPHF